ncbi:RNA polymerase sigma factor [Streptomyces tauricus]|uniref:Sigma-70 family RNA polymerase sigma factor n=1 Tax=Streptomyces tauricus TaxID=68274 RepID=A0ABZ1JWG5_9ACTN|nr:sigma-70 family RNA polymerase sigma factor [Streptomyces tauricus]
MIEPIPEPPTTRPSQLFDELFEEGFARVVRSLVLMGAGRAIAEDLAQDAFWTAYERWDEVGLYDHPLAWVGRTALNMWRQYCRTAHRREGLLAQADPWQLVNEGKDLVETDRRIDVQRALAQLPLRQREVVVLHYIFDQPVRVVARILEIAEGTVKSQLSDARRTLALMAGEGAERNRQGGLSGPERK